jgi:dipeptidase D
MGKLSKLQPEAVFRYFEEISKIPRCSGHEQKISDYLVSTAKKLNLEVIQDKVYNVIIRKPGTPGYESSPRVMLQGHMDMVCEKNKDTQHDFSKDPLDLQIKGDMVYANGTTLGADNGVAIAYALAILESEDIPHPPLEVILTIEEETGMGGVLNIDPKNITSKYLLNLDNEEEGKLLVSCAGGIRTRQYVKITWEHIAKDSMTAQLIVKGLKGGHSGMDIAKQRGNANKLLGRILNDLYQAFSFFIQEINGGSKMNAIPREAEAVIIFNPDAKLQLQEKIKEWQATLKNEYRVSDPKVMIELAFIEPKLNKYFNQDTTEKILTSLVLIPNGVKSMSMDIEGLVESSTNLGIVTTEKDDVVFESALRSSISSSKYSILEEAKQISKLVKARLDVDGDYPGWEYCPDSKLRPICEKVYEEINGQKPEIMAIHAGVECGLFMEKKPGIDAIAFGPNLYDVHSPDEHMSISSTQKTYEFLLALLKELK